MPALMTEFKKQASERISPITRRDVLALVLILLVAAIMRFGEPGIVEFYHDEAMLSMRAQEMAAGETFPTEGILSSVGIPNPPASVYVMWLPYLLTDDPLFATMYVAALNVIGVGLLWLLARRSFGRTAALAAGLAYALNPWAALYSRKIWAQDFHTPFVLAALILGVYGFIEAPSDSGRSAASPLHGTRSRAIFLARALCLPVLLFGLQIHFAAWALLPLYFVLLWAGRRQISRRALAASLALSALALLPYAIGFAQTLQKDPNRISDVIARSGMGGELSLSGDALLHVARFATGLGLETWVAPQQQADLLARVPPPTLLWTILAVVVLYGIIRLWLKPRHRLAMLLTLWVYLPLIAFTPTWTPVYPHYFVASIPALSVLAGVGVSGILSLRLPRMWSQERPVTLAGNTATRSLVLGGFAVILLTQGVWWRGLLRYLDAHNTPSGFTVPLHYVLAVRDELRKYDDVLIVSNGMDVLLHNEAAGWSVMLRKSARCVRTVPGDGYAVFPNHPFAVAIAPVAPENAVGNLYLTDSPKLFPMREREGNYAIHVFERAPEWSGPQMTAVEPVRFDNGVQLTGYHLQPDLMYLEWALPDGNPGLNYQYTGHFLDATGERLGQQDTGFWPGRYWCAGDRLITWTGIVLPDGATTLRVGMYVLDKGPSGWEYFSAEVLDVAGNPAGQWVDIPVTSQRGG